MAEMEPSEHCNRKRIRQPVSVPFLWEEKPGTPKKDWKPSSSTQTVNPVAPPPVKLVASVPFKWEEKPGKPLPCFSQQPPQEEIQLPPEDLITLAPPPAYSQDNDDDGHGSYGDDNRSEDETDEIEAFGFETDESFCSAPSLPANRLASTAAVSYAVPVLQTSLMTNNSEQLPLPSSPTSETDSSTSSYATGTTSLVGASFLECLFPLLSPDSSFLEKLGCSEKSTSHTPTKAESKDFDCESSCSVAVKRPPTLGELIMMSRRRSYRRKAVQMRRQNLSLESMKKRAVGCCIFGINNLIERLQQKWKRQLRLKLT